MNGLQWELDWVWKNRDQYCCDLHALSVIENIKKRYQINKLKDEIEKLKK